MTNHYHIHGNQAAAPAWEPKNALKIEPTWPPSNYEQFVANYRARFNALPWYVRRWIRLKGRFSIWRYRLSVVMEVLRGEHD